MIDPTKIAWTDYTWNIATGCTKVSEGCKFCYMMRDAERYNKPGRGTVVTKTKTVFNKPDKITGPSNVWAGPPLVFTSSLTDFFHEGCDPFRNEAWDKIRKNKHLIFQILTKRIERVPNNLPEYWKELTNIWLGVSVEKNEYLSRVKELIKVPGPQKKFISIEPLLEKLSIYDLSAIISEVDWVIVGGESGNDTGPWGYRPCELEWIEEIVEVCKKYNVPVFVKQLGTHLGKELKISRHGNKVKEFPKHLQIQQFPPI